MYVKVNCPVCREIHYITINLEQITLFQGSIVQDLICPNTNKRYILEITIRFKQAPTFTKEEIKIAEEEARQREKRWLIEEDYYKCMDEVE